VLDVPFAAWRWCSLNSMLESITDWLAAIHVRAGVHHWLTSSNSIPGPRLAF
jgi:hypothetical protein